MALRIWEGEQADRLDLEAFTGELATGRLMIFDRASGEPLRLAGVEGRPDVEPDNLLLELLRLAMIGQGALDARGGMEDEVDRAIERLRPRDEDLLRRFGEV